MNGMHISREWSELGFTDHPEDLTAVPANTLTDFKNQCLCRPLIVDGVQVGMAHNPNCEQNGHGCRSREVEVRAMERISCREVGSIHSGRRSAEQ